MLAMDTIGALISSRGLHKTVPVDLSWVEDLYDVYRCDLTPVTWGFGYFEDDAKVIGVNRNLHPYQQRMVIAHELAHHCLRHEPPDLKEPVFSCRSDVAWWHVKQELHAQWAAATLLLPGDLLLSDLLDGMTFPELESKYEVPSLLLKLRTDMADFCRAAHAQLGPSCQHSVSSSVPFFLLS